MSTITDNTKILAFIAQCDDPGKLKSLINNARKDAPSVADAAFRKLISLVPSDEPGTVGYDLWRTIHAFEFMLTEERGRTTLLARTRQKLKRVGVMQTLTDWALKGTETNGFKMLIARGMPELTGEAIVLRHQEQFAPDVVAAAGRRLITASVDITSLPARVQ